MSATMASANLRATGVAPRVAARSNAAARVAQMFRTAGPNAEQKLGDAMVAAAAKFGAKHQMEVKAALSEDVSSGDRRAFLKKALLGVRNPPPRSRREPPARETAMFFQPTFIRGMTSGGHLAPLFPPDLDARR